MIHSSLGTWYFGGMWAPMSIQNILTHEKLHSRTWTSMVQSRIAISQRGARTSAPRMKKVVIANASCTAAEKSRRAAVFAIAGFCALSNIGIAEAESIQTQLRRALQGPVQFLRARQKSKGGEFLLSPIKGSRRRLETALKALEQQNVYDPDLLIYKSALNIVRSASLNCYLFEAFEGDTLETRMSLLQKQLGFGDACTFRLIEKNVVSLLPPSKDGLKKDAARALTDLIRAYQHLDDVLYRAYGGDVFAAEDAMNSLQYTIASTATFQTVIEQCLDIEPGKAVSVG